MRWEEVHVHWCPRNPLVRIKSRLSKKIFKDCKLPPPQILHHHCVGVFEKGRRDDQLEFVGNVVAFLLKTSPPESAEGHSLAGGGRL